MYILKNLVYENGKIVAQTWERNQNEAYGARNGGCITRTYYPGWCEGSHEWINEEINILYTAKSNKIALMR
jgi:hypothetical protein